MKLSLSQGCVQNAALRTMRARLEYQRRDREYKNALKELQKDKDVNPETIELALADLRDRRNLARGNYNVALTSQGAVEAAPPC